MSTLGIFWLFASFDSFRVLFNVKDGKKKFENTLNSMFFFIFTSFDQFLVLFNVKESKKKKLKAL